MLNRLAHLKSENKDVRRAAASAFLVKSFEEKEDNVELTVKALLSGLLSVKVDNQMSHYMALVIMLSRSDRLQTLGFVQSAINPIFGTKKSFTKSERRKSNIGRIMTWGAVTRSCTPSDYDKDKSILNNAWSDLVKHLDGKLRCMAWPIVCHLVNTITKEQFESIEETLQPFIQQWANDPDENPHLLTIVITLSMRGFIDMAVVDEKLNAEYIANTFLTTREMGDEWMKLCIAFIQWKGDFEAFWSSLCENVRGSHFVSLCQWIEESFVKECHVTHMVKPQVIRVFLHVLANPLEQLTVTLAKQIISKLLKTFSSDQLHKKERKKMLKILFGGPCLVDEYKMLSGALREHANWLTVKELILVAGLIEDQLMEGRLPIRLLICRCHYLLKLSQGTQANSDVRSKIFDILNQLIFEQVNGQTQTKEDEDDEDEDEEKNEDENVLKAARSSVLSLLGQRYDSELNDHVSNSLDSMKDKLDWKVKTWNHLNNSRSCSVTEIGFLANCYAFSVYAGKGNGLTALENLSKIANALNKKKKGSENETAYLIEFYISDLLNEKEPIIDYERFFNLFVRKYGHNNENVQSLVEAIDVLDEDEDEDDEVKSNGFGKEKEEHVDDDNEAESVDEEMGDVNAEDMDTSDMSSEDEDEDEEIDESMIQKMKLELCQNGVNASDSEESMDLDSAAPEDLERLDTALIKVFQAKKAFQNEKKMEAVFTARVVHLLQIIFSRGKSVTLSQGLIVVPPVLTHVQKCWKGRNTELLSAFIKLLEKMNKIKWTLDDADVMSKSDMRAAQNDINKRIEAIKKMKTFPDSMKSLLTQTSATLCNISKQK